MPAAQAAQVSDCGRAERGERRHGNSISSGVRSLDSYL